MKEARPALHQTSTRAGREPASAETVAAADKSSDSPHYYV